VKFGILQFFSWPERRVALPTVYQRALQRIEIMDQNNYDAVWLTEHHFSDYSVCPSIPVLGTYAAARTTRLHIGAGITLAAFYHPLRLAEELALLDILSGGRVKWGAGRGFDAREFKAFQVPMEESYDRFHEVVDIVLQAWSNERLTYQGKYFSFENVEVLPKPLQQPHPPVWMAAGTARALEWAASVGHSVLMGPHATHAELARDLAFYNQQLAAHGHTVTGRDIPMARLLAIAKTDAEAKEVARLGAQWLIKTYIDAKALFGADIDPVQRYVDSVIIHGTPERVLDHIRQLHEETPLNYLIGAPLSHETFLTFTEQVLPKLP